MRRLLQRLIASEGYSTSLGFALRWTNILDIEKIERDLADSPHGKVSDETLS